MPLKIIALNCTLKASTSEKPSSTEKMLRQILDALARFEVNGAVIRIADYNIKPGVSADEGDGDAWPKIREAILASDILLIGTPIWLGQPSSLCKRVLERLDAFFSEADEEGMMPTHGKLALLAVVGNEDGAHHVTAEVFQALNDLGFTIPASAVSYWVGEAMGRVNYNDLPETPKSVANAIALMARNSAHLATLMKAKPYPKAALTKAG